VDTYIRSGIYPVKPDLPYTPGKDTAGVVQAIGKDVTKFKVGDRVFATRKTAGAYAEYAVCPVTSVWPLSARLSFAQGAAIGTPYFTAYRALFQRAHARPSHRVLVHGASGGVGLAAVQLARSHGMAVFGTAGTAEGLQLVSANGAHHVFNHRNPSYIQELLAATGGEGFDVILEMLANVNLGKDCELVRLNGTVVVIGSRGTVEINPRALMSKDAQILAMNLNVVTDERDWSDMAAALLAGLENGTLTPVVDREYPLEKASDAHYDIIYSPGAKGNLVLRIRPE
jgi:NADPH2:quinone reductase